MARHKVHAVVNSVSVFFSYSHVDEALRNALDVHMAPLRRGKLISTWHDRRIGAGTEWDAAIDARMRAADIIVLLLSPDFFNSDYCHDVEIPAALARHASGEAVVIPVVLRPFNWYESPVAHLQSIPRDKKAVTLWDNLDLAYQAVVEGIREVASHLLEQRREQALQHEAAHDRYRTRFLEALADHQISIPERETLDELRDKLGLSPAAARAIEIEAEAPIKQYRENLERYRGTLRKVLAEEYPIGARNRADLQLRRHHLGLRDEDADRVEAPILAEAEAAHRARRAAHASPPPAAQAAPPSVTRGRKFGAAARTSAPPQRPSPSPQPPPPPPPPRPAVAPAPAPVVASASRVQPAAPVVIPSWGFGVAALPSAAAQSPAPVVAPAGAGVPDAPPASGFSAVAPPRPSPPAVQTNLDVGAVVSAVLARADKNAAMYLAPNIPADKLATAVKYCAMPGDETALCLVDLTVFGSASDAMIIGRRGLYFRNYVDTPTTYRMTWAAWANTKGDFKAKYLSVVTPEGQKLTFSPVGTEEVVKLLHAIRHALRAGAGSVG